MNLGTLFVRSSLLNEPGRWINKPERTIDFMEMKIDTDRCSLTYLKQGQATQAVFDNTPLAVNIKIP